MASKRRLTAVAVAVTALVGAGVGAALVVRARVPATMASEPDQTGRDEGARVLSASDPIDTVERVPVNDEPPAWTDGLHHVVLSTSASPSVADPAGPGAAQAIQAEQAVLRAVRAMPGVQAAHVVAPGTIGVATSGTPQELAKAPGVTGTVDDVPMGATGDRLESTQWQLANDGTRIPSYPTHAAKSGADIAATGAWRVTEGAGVIVAVIDSGVDGTHPDLAARMWTNPGENCTNKIDDDGNGLVNDCAGWDFGSNDNNPAPDAGAPKTEHGTHVAGLIAASRNGVGVVGAAPGATILPLKVTDAKGGSGTGQMTAAIRYAVDKGAKVINISMGTGFGPTRAQLPTLEAAIAYARSKGVLIVAAAGNDGRDMANADSWPASYAKYYDNVIAVGATWNDDTRASFSNFGLPANAMVYAPGVAVPSTLPGGLWGPMSGTSMASPLAAGSAALVIASGRAVAPADVRALMVRTADNVGYGGRINDSTALGAAVVPVTPTTLAATTTTTAPATTTTTRPPLVTTTTKAPVATTTTTKAPAPTTTTAKGSPVVTTPTPAPATSGAWRLDSISVRAAPLTGGRQVTLVGKFPASGAVYVWFGPTGPIVPAQVLLGGAQLLVTTPVVGTAQVTEVTVKFSDGARPVVLAMPRAFTFAPGA